MYFEEKPSIGKQFELSLFLILVDPTTFIPHIGQRRGNLILLASPVYLIWRNRLLTFIATIEPKCALIIGFTRLMWCRIINHVLPTFIQTGVFAVLSLTCQHILIRRYATFKWPPSWERLLTFWIDPLRPTASGNQHHYFEFYSFEIFCFSVNCQSLMYCIDFGLLAPHPYP